MLAWRVRQRKAETAIDFVRDTGGTLQGKTKNILRIFKTYYKDLYTSGQPHKNTIDSFFTNNSLFKTLSDEHRSMMDATISGEEITKAIKQLKNNKAAGPDGYPAEFFKFFLNDLLPMLEPTYNTVLLRGDVPQSWSKATLVPIPKPGKDRTSCKSYRPDYSCKSYMST